MTDKKIVDLNTLASMVNTDLILVRDTANAETKNISLSGLWSGILDSTILANDIEWVKVDKTGSSLDDLETKNATDLQVSGPDVLLGRINSGSGDVTTIACTAFARTILDDPDADTVISTLGLDISEDELTYALRGWYKVSDLAYTAAMPNEYFDGTNIQTANNWFASTSYIAGDIIIPTVSNDFLYLCTVGGSSDLTEPTWPTTLGGAVSDNDITWVCINKHVLTTSIDLRAHTAYKEGCAVKVKIGSSYYYGKIYYALSTRLVIKLSADAIGDIDELYFGLDKLRIINFNFNGIYNVDTSTLLETHNEQSYRWFFEEGKIVDLQLKHILDDSTIQPLINIINPSGPVFDTNLIPRVSTSFSWHYCTTSAYNSIGLASDIEISCDKDGGTGNATSLSLFIVVVLE